ncbi:undecaprenyl-phosphate glucose phosphotransferase [Microbulbifer magnicolonia]|uniref:undecaprenyl-phosphate glucose phosphotransferase n=1 Tax=Microbulbifer magnicolonia TaxID=3109744 RepID=UPI002B402690|nr:undecaprenyl-phosphate glucose phosphotransferase [Microbulbifer sp. GG15]
MQQGWVRLHERGLAALYRLFDGLLIFLILVFCLTIWGHDVSKDWLIVALLAIASFTFLAESVDLYRSWRVDSYLSLLGACSFAWISVCLFLLLIGYFSKLGTDYSRLVVGSWFFLTLLLLLSWRMLLRQFLCYFRARDRNIRRVAIIGVTNSGLRVARDIDANPQLGIRVEGFYRVPQIADSVVPNEQLERIKVLGDVSDAVALARAGQLDYVYVALPMREEDKIAEILAAFADTTATVHLLPDFFVANMLHARWYQLGSSSLLSVYDTPIVGLNSWLKRMEDLVLASLALIALAPLMLAISFGIRLTSPGPIIFRQRRYGLDGRVIDVWKFRTMRVQEDGDKIQQANRNDSRVTTFGRLLRRTSLDELPQLINVLQGSMSIVGPRPHAVAHNEQYRGLVSGYMLRHKVKPGITGWAQVNGWRGETDTLDKMSKRVEFDLHYIRNWSFLFDLRILMLTLSKGFVSTNAY